MTIKIESTTDTPAQVRAAIGGAKAKEKEVEKPAAAVDKTEDTAEIPDTSGESDEEPEETLDTEEKVAKGEDEESEDEGDSKDLPKKPLKGFKKRIDKLSRRVSDTERERDYWKQEALRAKTLEVKVETPKEAKAEGKPKADDFDTHEEYVEKLATWNIDQRLKEQDAKQRETQTKTEQQRLVDDFRSRIKTLAEKHEDFEDVMESVDDIQMSIAVQQLLLDSKNGHELSYHLAKNREEFERICKLPPLAAAREMGKFEAKYLKAPEETEPKQIKTTKAPAPINPVGSKGSAPTVKSLSDPNLTQKEYEALRAKQRSRSA